MMRFKLMDMFPAYSDPGEIDLRQIGLLRLCAKIGVPFPAEPNESYAVWWRSLHEIGHWAVKPDWYVNYARYLRDDLATEWGSLEISAGAVRGLEQGVNIPCVGRYAAGNDVIPDLGLLEAQDPTPGEFETRVWSLQVLDLMGWPHPSQDNTEAVTTGDEFFHKPTTARVWLPSQKDSPRIKAHMQRWGLDVLSGKFRPYDAPNDVSFALPFPQPSSFEQLQANVAYISQIGNADKPSIPAEEEREWMRYLEKRWSSEDLGARAIAQTGQLVS